MTLSKRGHGIYYSPEAYARLLVRWTSRLGATTYMDPSYGGCAFLHEALDELRAREIEKPESRLFGADIDPAARQAAQGNLFAAGVPTRNLVNSDFLLLEPGVDLPMVDAVVGNPPYVRHHAMSEDSAINGQRLAATSGISISRRASLWAYFVIHATSFVADRGHMALLLPGSLVNAQYGAQIIAFLQAQFASLQLFRVRERIFSDANEETIVLLASGRGGTTRATMHDVADLKALERVLLRNDEAPSSARANGDQMALDGWKLAALDREARDLFTALLDDPRTLRLGDVAQVRIGTVTGANEFFVRETSSALAVAPRDCMVATVPRTAWITASEFSASRHQAFAATRPAWFLAVPRDTVPSPALASQIAEAEKSGIHLRRHCQRDPWWSLPTPHIPDAFLPYMGGRARGIAINSARAGSTNAVHHLTWTGHRTRSAHAGLAAGSWSALSALSAELFGRHYGGGVLKLEPSEASRMVVFVPPEAPDLDDGQDARSLGNNLLCTTYGIGTREIALLEAATERLSRARRGGT